MNIISPFLMEKKLSVGTKGLSPYREFTNTPWASTLQGRGITKGGRTKGGRLSFTSLWEQGCPPPVQAVQGDSLAATVASQTGLGYQGHTLGVKHDLEGHLCRKQSKHCKVSLQGGCSELVPVGLCWGKPLLTIAIHGTCWGETTPGKTHSPCLYLAASPGQPPPNMC